MEPTELSEPDLEAATDGAAERFVAVGDVELCCEELGDPDGEPLLLVMGLGAQMIYWDEGFCELLGDRGYRVIRFDNRDVGRSTHLRAPVPGRAAMLLGRGRPAHPLHPPPPQPNRGPPPGSPRPPPPAPAPGASARSPRRPSSSTAPATRSSVRSPAG